MKFILKRDKSILHSKIYNILIDGDIIFSGTITECDSYISLMSNPDVEFADYENKLKGLIKQ